ncbi:orotate phosphoribosyltransferase [Polychytrium aggregatum]|uniref:orotate phosphoribosyltransferase n=1 Tax=Polychytrium aggregatum TaxID=110093 RepID=UPI0022FE586D|nr:orotate phosphoribosyltransferase [Polychytrium aggregatum]KAI9207806.1 orotate phosphoribosyltransferase [Polychytrium aggregatum]
MKEYQREFLQFAIENKVLTFGSFKLKSGRISPYFFNAGLFNTGEALARLGKYYASAIVDSGLQYDVLFGPAYKGIPLVSATSVALYEHHKASVPYSFNRKEAKDHGEGGNIVGAALKGRIAIIDDVITAGTAIRESAALITANNAQVAGLIIALDRQERVTEDSPYSAIQQVEMDLKVPVISIVKMEHLIEYLAGLSGFEKEVEDIKQYRAKYGIA